MVSLNIQTLSKWTHGVACGASWLSRVNFLPALSLISRLTQVDHDNVPALRLDPPLRNELWRITGLKVIRLHRTGGSLLMSLPSAPTNPAAPPEYCPPVRWDKDCCSAWWDEEEALRFSPTTTTFFQNWVQQELCTWPTGQVITTNSLISDSLCQHNNTIIYQGTSAEGIYGAP